MTKEDVCCIKGCCGSLMTNHLHKFPRYPVRQKQWVDKLNYNYLRKLPPHLLEKKVVCHKHFEDKFKSKKLRQVLKRNAIPTIFLDSTNLPTHRFPHPQKDTERYSAWVAAVGEKSYNKTEEEIVKNHRICDKHFEDKYQNRHHRLMNIAVPTLHLKPLQDDKIYYVGTNDEENDSDDDELDNSTNQSNIALALSEDHDYTALQEGPAQSQRLTQSEGLTHSKDDSGQNLDSDVVQSHNDVKMRNLENNVTALVLITVPEKEIGSEIGRALIEHDLAACVEVIADTKSIYKCQGKVREDNKVLLLAKTRSSKVTELSKYTAEHFPLAGYQIVSMPIDNGNPHYLKWIADSVPTL